MDKTKKIVIEMLTENTGTHFLDSGGAYGRHWERNKAFGTNVKKWDSLPEYHLEIWKSTDFYHIVNLYHHMVNYLEFDSKMDAKFRCFDKKLNESRDRYEQTTWNESLEEFRKVNPDIKFTRGDYTYNQENSLSQDIIYTPYDDGDFNDGVIIEIHNGCDARGGFTAPRFFRVKDESFYDFDGMPSLMCENKHRWFYEQGYHHNWVNDDGLPNLEDYESLEYDDLSDEQQAQFDTESRLIESPEAVFATDGQENLPGINARLKKPAEYKKALICKDKTLYCPECGKELTI